jgi:hypothetical protein
MAKVSDAAVAHRSVAERVPEAIRTRMPQEELRHRSEHVFRIEESAPSTGEARTALLAHARKVLRSLPVGEFIRRKKELHDIAMSLPAGGFDSPMQEMMRAGSELDKTNSYPAGLVTACENRLLGKAPSYPEADIDQILGIPPRQGVSK